MAFLPAFNSVSLIKSETAELVAQVDACLQGAGGICASRGYYSFTFPEGIADCHFTISSLECFNILVALRLWALDWQGKHVFLYSDNWSAVCAANSGAATDPLIHAVVRELWWICATRDIELALDTDLGHPCLQPNLSAGPPCRRFIGREWTGCWSVAGNQSEFACSTPAHLMQRFPSCRWPFGDFEEGCQE